MSSLRKMLLPLTAVLFSAGGCANLGAPSNSDDLTVGEQRPTTGSRVAEGNPAQKVDVISRDEIDATGANTVEEVLRRKVVNR